MASYSVIIRGGRIIDGLGFQKTYQADIGIRDERIHDIGNLANSRAEIEIDATNKYVTPGFIDITNHSDTHWTIFDIPRQDSLLKQGITTIIGGNCGVSLAPLVSGEEIDAIKKWVDTSDINVNWQSVEEYLNQLEKNKIGVNFGTMVGFGTLRRSAVRNSANVADATEIEKMKFLLEEALADGAFGMSTSLGRAHEQASGRQELATLAEVVAKNDGVLKHHLRDEGQGILPAISEVINLARETGAKTSISHFKILGKNAWPHYNSAIIMLEQALKDSLPVSLDVFPYTKTGSSLYLLLPSWALAGSRDNIIKNITDKIRRQEIIKELEQLTLHYERMIVSDTLRDPTATGKTLAEISSRTGLTPEEAILEMLLINDLQVTIFNEVVHQPHLDNLARKFYAHFATDGFGLRSDVRREELPHPRTFGGMPKALNYFVKLRGHLSWEEAIYKMSGFPAKVVGIKNRGTIEINSFADVAVLDPDLLADKANYSNPLQYAEGINWVLVNGKVAVTGGKLSDSLYGTVLRKISK